MLSAAELILTPFGCRRMVMVNRKKNGKHKNLGKNGKIFRTQVNNGNEEGNQQGRQGKPQKVLSRVGRRDRTQSKWSLCP